MEGTISMKALFRSEEKNCFTPVLTTRAGACLTLANWQEVGIDRVCYYLDALLLKPGFAFLSTLSGLRSYLGWQGTMVLNATLPAVNDQGVYSLRSHYDGTFVHLQQAELFALIMKLQPNVVIWPPRFAKYHDLLCQSLPKTLTSFFPVNETPAEGVFGQYLDYNGTAPFADFLKRVNQYRDRPIYVAGELNLAQAVELVSQGIALLESDKPATDAILGLVYSEKGNLALLDSEMAYQQEVIDANCSCPTCSQGFKRAYLHHLLKRTPFLCQRFLIQHNVYYYRNHLPIR
jgi:queuine tRNA-ribosyltransferase